eukprot:CAMPEP_0181183392 /NCGR_PEP_ID=MMETSP1096-20121128/8401_1 /TAXON_ID=156174 ORGANISM="Chrysochromulina ericina, Strain CCMP281" /NCGR_SAMPLE_ID=MMETSP1096 /ASSEMBLY_ACC=CAM_ASM_000453 /LENGTH=70 /DNA_ID=CAMNT_0023272069 /DNA_START=736 /DNA_END=949 /DNA_ORIENTATION=+
MLILLLQLGRPIISSSVRSPPIPCASAGITSPSMGAPSGRNAANGSPSAKSSITASAAMPPPQPAESPAA